MAMGEMKIVVPNRRKLLRRLDAVPGFQAIARRAIRHAVADEVKRAQWLASEADRRLTIMRLQRWAKEQRRSNGR